MLGFGFGAAIILILYIIIEGLRHGVSSLGTFISEYQIIIIIILLTIIMFFKIYDFEKPIKVVNGEKVFNLKLLIEQAICTISIVLIVIATVRMLYTACRAYSSIFDLVKKFIDSFKENSIVIFISLTQKNILVFSLSESTVRNAVPFKLNFSAVYQCKIEIADTFKF